MKRLVGGDYLLDLSSIELEESEDGSTKTNITDSNVLEQLTNLKKYIKNPEMAKPVWVKLKNGENDELVIARGTFAVVDTGEFEICVQLDGYKLVIFIEFTQATLSDDTPIDDWYIDTNDAKYLFTSDAQAIAGQLADFTGDVKIYENITDADGNKRFLSGDIDNVAEFVADDEIVYAKWTLSGNHLMLVFAFISDGAKDLAGDTFANVTLPQWIADKIYPMTDGVSHVAVSQGIYGYIPSNLAKSSVAIVPYISKVSNQLRITCDSDGTIEDGKYYRIVFDLVIA